MNAQEAIDGWAIRLKDLMWAVDKKLDSKDATFILLSESPERIRTDIAEYLDSLGSSAHNINCAEILSNLLIVAQSLYLVGDPYACLHYLRVARRIVTNQLKDELDANHD